MHGGYMFGPHSGTGYNRTDVDVELCAHQGDVLFRKGLSEERLRAAVEQALPKGGEMMATLAQKWMEQGLQQGLQQGRQEGRREGLVRAIVALLRLRLQPSEVWLEEVRGRLEAVEDPEKLEALHLTAAQVESTRAFEQALEEE